MYKFYFDDMLLPITPESMTTKIGGRNTTLDLVNGGEVNLVKFPKLAEYSFEFELIHNIENIPYRASDTSPKEVLDFLENAKKKKLVFNFRVIREMGNSTRFATDQKVTVESYDVKEDADNNSDMTVSIELKHFKPYRTKHLGAQSSERADMNTVKKNAKKVIDNVKKSSVIEKKVLKRLDIKADALNIRTDAGTSYDVIAKFKKGEKPFAYGEKTVNGTVWYKVKHSASKSGFAWISGNSKYTSVNKDIKA